MEKQKFLKLKILDIPDSKECVISPSVFDVNQFNDLEVGQKYSLEIIELDKEEYEKLEDFKGF